MATPFEIEAVTVHDQIIPSGSMEVFKLPSGATIPVRDGLRTETYRNVSALLLTVKPSATSYMTRWGSDCDCRVQCECECECPRVCPNKCECECDCVLRQAACTHATDTHEFSFDSPISITVVIE